MEIYNNTKITMARKGRKLFLVVYEVVSRNRTGTSWKFEKDCFFLG